MVYLQHVLRCLSIPGNGNTVKFIVSPTTAFDNTINKAFLSNFWTDTAIVVYKMSADKYSFFTNSSGSGTSYIKNK